MGQTFQLYTVVGYYNLIVHEIIDSKENSLQMLVRPSSEEGIYQSTKILLNSNDAQKFLDENGELKQAELIKW
ncbi:hypothetical protein J2X75_001909 [Paenibacillus sp. 2003]|nr:hypothetical protein [Paenibacillus sp. 2003]